MIRVALCIFVFLVQIAIVYADQPPIIPVIDAAMKAQLRNIYLAGISAGNRPAVFAKVGDSITRSRFYLKDIGCSIEVLAGNRRLAPTIEFFRATAFPPSFTTAWCGDANSFSRDSITAANGWTAADPLTPFPDPVSVCPPPQDNPLRCELRLMRPSLALIMLGTNDVGDVDHKTFRSNLTRVVNEIMIQGVVPVLSTIPPRLDSPVYGRMVPAYNRIIQEVSRTLQVPLWNYWLVLQSPGMIHQGIDSHGIHPNVFNDGDAAVFTAEALRYGFNQRNLTALQVLQKMKAVIENNASPDATSSPNFAIFCTQLISTVRRGTTLILKVKITRVNLLDPVALRLDTPSEGISGTFQTNAAATVATLSLKVLKDVRPGDYRITIRGTDGTRKRTSTFALTVTK